MKAIALVLLAIVPLTSYAKMCFVLIDIAESASRQGDLESAKKNATEAIAICQKEKVKSARHYMVLATAAFQEEDYPSVVKWSEKGLLEEPGLPLAYMNICAAHNSLKAYDKAIAACEKGAKTDSQWKAKLLHNEGLAYFGKAVDAEKYDEAKLAEPFFMESSKIDPNLAENYFYLGTIASAVKNDNASARSSFTKGCELKEQRACSSLAQLPKDAPAAKSAPAAAAVTPKGKEKDLVERIVKGYIKKGMQETQARSAVNDMMKGLASMPEAQRITTLETVAKSIE